VFTVSTPRDGLFQHPARRVETNEHRSPMAPASPEIEEQLDKILAEIGLI
jgi:hypothetical protein